MLKMGFLALKNLVSTLDQCCQETLDIAKRIINEEDSGLTNQASNVVPALVAMLNIEMLQFNTHSNKMLKELVKAGATVPIRDVSWLAWKSDPRVLARLVKHSVVQPEHLIKATKYEGNPESGMGFANCTRLLVIKTIGNVFTNSSHNAINAGRTAFLHKMQSLEFMARASLRKKVLHDCEQSGIIRIDCHPLIKALPIQLQTYVLHFPDLDLKSCFA